MKLAKLLFVLVVFVALFFNAAFALAEDHEEDEDDTAIESDESEEPYSSLQGVSRFLRDSRKPISQTNCKKNPKICRKKGSPGRDCCKKKCVDFKTDRLNCGSCGKKCRYSNICCKGKCVNQFFDRKNCGGCKKRCGKGKYCEYGMCNYA